MSAPTLEVRTERDRSMDIGTGEWHDVVRIRYRQQGTRYWTRFIVVPNEGETIEEIIAQADEIAATYMRLKASA